MTHAAAVRLHLEHLATERYVALETGLGDNATYLADLDAELVACRAAYVGSAVVEIAMLRGELGERNVG